MRAVDTNLLVRLLTDDDPAQAEIVAQVLASDTVFVPKTVVLEFEWVLRSVYGLSRAAIAAGIERLLETVNMELEDQATVARAVGWFKRGMDLADALHLASSGHAVEFVTFDVALRRRAASLGIETPVVAP
jgi:predicted nucleic-acid-binding protein